VRFCVSSIVSSFLIMYLVRCNICLRSWYLFFAQDVIFFYLIVFEDYVAR
jgi:hypothetical protein